MLSLFRHSFSQQLCMYYSLEYSYETVLQTPPEITQDPKAIIIVPAFFHTGWTIANGTLEEQVASYVKSSFIIHHSSFVTRHSSLNYKRRN